MADLGADPGELERVEERLFAHPRLARKHGSLPDDLPELAEDLRARLAALDGGGGRHRRAGGGARRGGGRAMTRPPRALSAPRRAAAARLDAAWRRELAPLKLERAAFATEVAEAEPGPDGRDRVRFTVATNPGAPPGPMDRIASGGELSRFLLALKVCLQRAAPGPDADLRRDRPGRRRGHRRCGRPPARGAGARARRCWS